MHKRRRLEPHKKESPDVPEEEDELYMEEASKMDDALVAVELLRSQFPKTPSHPMPIILMSQIYSLVKDRTSVDRSLGGNSQDIRMFMAPGSSTEILVQHMTDYKQSLLDSCKRAMDLESAGGAVGQSNRTPGKRNREGEQGKQINAKKIFGRFATKVLPEYTGVFSKTIC
jgi:hypothetical protein